MVIIAENKGDTDFSCTRILADLRSTTYCTAVGNGGAEEWEFVFEQYPTAESANEANNFIAALACTSHAYLLNR